MSPESIGIFDFILEVYSTCSGDWEKLAKDSEVNTTEIAAFLEYSATFLSNIGNYYVGS